MPIPPNALLLAQPIDPTDVVEFAVTLSQGAADSVPTPFLAVGEAVASFTLTVTAEGAAAGLQIRNDGAYAPTLSGNKLTFWPIIATGQQSASIFAGDGVKLGVELTAVTNSNPARTKQRTIVLQVAQQ